MWGCPDCLRSLRMELRKLHIEVSRFLDDFALYHAQAKRHNSEMLNDQMNQAVEELKKLLPKPSGAA